MRAYERGRHARVRLDRVLRGRGGRVRLVGALVVSAPRERAPPFKVALQVEEFAADHAVEAPQRRLFVAVVQERVSEADLGVVGSGVGAFGPGQEAERLLAPSRVQQGDALDRPGLVEEPVVPQHLVGAFSGLSVVAPDGVRVCRAEVGRREVGAPVQRGTVALQGLAVHVEHPARVAHVQARLGPVVSQL